MKLYKKTKTNMHKIYTVLGVNFKKKIRQSSVRSLASYSQLGEDVMFRGFLCDERNGIKTKGFYIDIGAHHPERYSNTKMLYDQGWSGINIEPMQNIIDLFNIERPNDINLCVAIAPQSGEMDYYMFSEHGINTLSQEFANGFINDPNSPFKFLGKKKIPVMRLEDVLDKYLPEKQEINLLNIDAEGLDLSILESNNWNKYRPEFILIEIHNYSTISDILKSPVAEFLHRHNYDLAGQAFCTSLFRRKGVRP